MSEISVGALVTIGVLVVFMGLPFYLLVRTGRKRMQQPGDSEKDDAREKK